jgi:hypothetical protein
MTQKDGPRTDPLSPRAAPATGPRVESSPIDLSEIPTAAEVALNPPHFEFEPVASPPPEPAPEAFVPCALCGKPVDGVLESTMPVLCGCDEEPPPEPAEERSRAIRERREVCRILGEPFMAELADAIDPLPAPALPRPEEPAPTVLTGCQMKDTPETRELVAAAGRILAAPRPPKHACAGDGCPVCEKWMDDPRALSAPPPGEREAWIAGAAAAYRHGGRTRERAEHCARWLCDVTFGPTAAPPPGEERLRERIEALATEWDTEAERREREAQGGRRHMRTTLQIGARFERNHAERLRAALREDEKGAKP